MEKTRQKAKEKNEKNVEAVNRVENPLPGYVAAIVVNIALIWIVNNILNWQVPALTLDFDKVSWFFELSFIASILANLIFIVWRSKAIQSLLSVITNLFSIYALFMFNLVFPLNFANSTNEMVARVVIYIALLGTVIGAIVELVKFAINLAKNE